MHASPYDDGTITKCLVSIVCVVCVVVGGYIFCTTTGKKRTENKKCDGRQIFKNRMEKRNEGEEEKLMA